MSKPSRFRFVGPLILFGIAACSEPSGANDVSEKIDQTAVGTSLSLSCSGCHSDASGAIASLSSYSEDLLREALLQYKTDPYGTTVMHRLARGYSDEEIALISADLAARERAE